MRGTKAFDSHSWSTTLSVAFGGHGQVFLSRAGMTQAKSSRAGEDISIAWPLAGKASTQLESCQILYESKKSGEIIGL